MVFIENGDRTEDIYSSLLRDRIIFIGEEITPELANEVVGQLLLLEIQDKNKDIKIYINSPGGDITSGFAIYDTMQFIKPKVHTVCMGMAASMAAILLAAGEKGCRKALPHAEIMIHQPSGGFDGTTTDVLIYAGMLQRCKETSINVLSKHTKQSKKKVSADLERDYFMTSEEALKYGLIDSIIGKSK